MKNINYKQLRKYDIGKMSTSTGYQPSQTVNTSIFSSTPATSYQNQAGAYNTQTWQQGLSKGASLGTGLMSMFAPGNYISPNAAITQNITTAGLSRAAAEGAAQGAGKTLAQVAAEEAKAAGGTVAKAGLTTAGQLAAGAGALYGAVNLVGDFNRFKDRITGSDMLQGASRDTQSKYGVTYNTYGGFDESGMMKTTDAQNRADVTATTTDAMSTGASIGGLVGSFLPGAGTIIGTGIGAAIGGISGLLGGKSAAQKRKEAVERDARETKSAMASYNTQQESDAATEGLREQFYNTHGYYSADKGKDAITRYAYGKDVKGLMSKDETWINRVTGETGYPGSDKQNVKDKRADVVPIGGPDFDNISILGHKQDEIMKYYTGKDITFADEARQAGKENERIKKQMAAIQKGKGDKHTKARNLEYLQGMLARNTEYINSIADRQQQQNLGNVAMYNCGKNAKYDSGKVNWGEYGSMLLPHIGQLGAVFASRRPYTPAYRESYVDDGSASDINQLRSLRYDPTQALANIHKASRAARYSAMNAGNISSGQRAAINSTNELAAATAANNIIDQYNEKNVGLQQTALQASIAAKQANAQRLQNAREQAYARNDRAQAIDDKFRQQYYANLAAQFGSVGKDWMSMSQYHNARDFQQKMIDMYNDKNKLDRDRFDWEVKNAKPANTPVAEQATPIIIPRGLGNIYDPIQLNIPGLSPVQQMTFNPYTFKFGR